MPVFPDEMVAVIRIPLEIGEPDKAVRSYRAIDRRAFVAECEADHLRALGHTIAGESRRADDPHAPPTTAWLVAP